LLFDQKLFKKILLNALPIQKYAVSLHRISEITEAEVATSTRCFIYACLGFEYDENLF
jgi:hypothetical protein